MADKKGKAISISFTPDQIVGGELVKSGDYKFASIGVKVGENERMRISYEWSGNTLPDFVMNLMGWMQANEIKFEETEEYANLKKRAV